MLRRTLFVFLTIIAVSAGRAEAVSIRDVIELSKAGLSDSVLLALIEVDRGVFSIDTPTLKQLKEAGVSEAVIVAMIRSGRTPRPVEPPPPEPMQTNADPNANANPYPYGYPDLPERDRERQPQVIVIDHHDQQPQTAQTMYPIGISVPGYFATSPFVTSPFATRRGANQTVNTIVNTDQGLVKARVPVPAGCVKAQPVFWGFGGKLRPGSYQPPPTVLCQ